MLTIASHVKYFRGFVEGISIEAPTFLERAHELFSLAPIRSVRFLDAGPHIEALAASPHLERLVSISFFNYPAAPQLGDADLRALATSPYLGKLAMLDLSSNNIGLDGVEALAASKQLPQLRHVTLSHNPVEDPIEAFQIDRTTLQIDPQRVVLPPLGRVLEAKYGELPWLHWPSRFRIFPANEHDV